MSNVLVCCPVSAMPNPGTPGSISTPCHRCNEDVWVAPSGQALLKEKDPVEVICTTCFPDPDLLLSDATRRAAPGCLAELEAHGVPPDHIAFLERHFQLDEPIT